MYFRACRRVSGGCCNLGFVLGGTLTAMLVLHVIDNSQLKHEKTCVSESTGKPQISESTKKPQISECSEKAQISESTQTPQISESTEKPQINESTEKPRISESTENPKISESTEKPQINESTEKPYVLESSEKPQINESKEEIQINESKVKSKPLKPKKPVDWSDSLKSYSYSNMRNLRYKVKHKISIDEKYTKYSDPYLVVVGNHIWFSGYQKIIVYSRKGKFIKFLILDKKLTLYGGIKTGSGDICFASNKDVVGLDSNGKYRYTIYNGKYRYTINKKKIDDVAYNKGILYVLTYLQKKVLRFRYNDTKWVDMGMIRCPEQQNGCLKNYRQIEVSKDTVYAFNGNTLGLYNIQNNILVIHSYSIPKGSIADRMGLLSVDHKGVSLLSDMIKRVLRLCTEDGEWSIITHMQGMPIQAVIDPNDNGIWVVTKPFHRPKFSWLTDKRHMVMFMMIPEE